ncbi:MAG: hypothetical protein M3N48_10695 [Verrucomicrobiota bacterium]|nr:hypothetical protein [Verrucomicrobiota bacterium]
MKTHWAVAVAILIALLPGTTPAQTVFSGAGTAAATAARDNFRTAIGGGTTAGANGSFGGVRREINWDAVPANFAAPNNIPFDFFNVNSPRGLVFGSFGTGFQVSSATTDTGPGQPSPPNFGNIDPSYTTTFAPFSPQRLFTPFGRSMLSGHASNITYIDFFVPGTNTSAVVNGFGCIFSDVDLPNVTSIEYFDTVYRSLGKFYAPPIAGNQTVSFLGVLFSDKIVSHVEITTGNAAPDAGIVDGASLPFAAPNDVVVMDDFLYGEPVAAPARLLNLATRARVLAGDQSSIAGFIIVGTQGTSILVRGLGPSLTANGVPGALQDPMIELYKDNTLVKTNDNWKVDDKTGNSQQQQILNTGLPPTDDRESAIAYLPEPGTYTVVLRGKNNTTGIGVAEIYELFQSRYCALGNLSGRAFVDTGDNALFAGFISGDGGGGATRIVVRGIGPSLTAAGVPGALQDPVLTVFNNNGAIVASNDDWKTGIQQSEIEATGLAPSNDREAAIVGSFPAGTYSAIVRGKNNSMGVGLVEIYLVR